MQVLLFPFGTQGDVRPLVSIGATLRDRGHDILLAANPRFEGMARAAELDFEPLGTVEEYTAVLDNPDLWHPRRGPMLLHDYSFGPDLLRQREVVERRAKPNTVVVVGTFAVGARLGAEKLGLPCARMQGQPSVFFGAHDPPVLPSGKKMGGPLWLRKMMMGLFDKTIFRPLGKDLNAARRDADLAPRPKRFMGFFIDADVNLCLYPDWFAPATPDRPDNAHTIGFFVEPPEGSGELEAELSRFLADGAPPVVMTPGPAGYQHGDAFFRVAAEACAELGQRAVFVTRGQELGLELPAEVHACDYAPFGLLFPRAAAIVHHGGIGTVAHALAAGRPQLVTPFGFDQPDNACRLAELGVADSLMSKALTGPALARKLRALLDSGSMAKKAEALGKKIAEENGSPVQHACDLIEALAV